MVCCLFGTKPLSEPMLTHCWLNPWELTKCEYFPSKNTLETIICKMAAICLSLNVIRITFNRNTELNGHVANMTTCDVKSTLVQVMSWCRQTTSHYLSQCWPRSMLPYGITRPPWVKSDSKLFQHLYFSNIHLETPTSCSFYLLWLWNRPRSL